MQKGLKVTLKCVCCGNEFQSASTNGYYCEECRPLVRSKCKSYRSYCLSRDIHPHSAVVFRTFFKRYGKQGLKFDNEELLDIIDDIAESSTRTGINKELREDVLKAAQLGLSYGQYASLVRDIHK